MLQYFQLRFAEELLNIYRLPELSQEELRKQIKPLKPQHWLTDCRFTSGLHQTRKAKYLRWANMPDF